MALTREGRLWAFGCGANGLLGTGSAFDMCEPEWVGRSPTSPLHGKFVDMVACGRGHTLCVCQKEVFAWGANDQGQLGVGSTFDFPVPKLVTALSGNQVDGIACGFTHTVVLTQRHVYSFGLGSSGQLGHSNVKSYIVPKLINSIGADFRAHQVCCGPEYTVIASDYGDLLFFGNLRSKGKISTPKITCVPICFTGLDRVFALAAGAHEVSAIRILSTYPAIKPVPDFLKNNSARSDVKDSLFQQQRVGKMGRAHVFGSFENGRLGITRTSTAPAQRVPIMVTTGGLNKTPLLKVSCGKNFTVVLDVKGLLWSWGGNKFGQLGLGHKKEGVIKLALPARSYSTEEPCSLHYSRSKPAPILHFSLFFAALFFMRYTTVTVIARDMGESRMKHITNKFFTDIHCGGYHTIALTSKAKVFAWGKNKCALCIIASY
jgi:alpha-tubulin suppressor-like RCC1 family protein